MTERRYVIEYGDLCHRRVAKAPESYGADLLTRKQAAQRIIEEMSGIIGLAQDSRNRALRVFRAELKKERKCS